MATPITISTGTTVTITSTGVYSPITFTSDGVLNVTGNGVEATLGTITANGTDGFGVDNGATLLLQDFTSLSALNQYDIGSDGTLEISANLNAALLSDITFDNTLGTSATLLFANGASTSLADGINGFGSGDSIVLNGAAITGSSWTQNNTNGSPSAGGSLLIKTAGNTEALRFSSGFFTDANFATSGHTIDFACFTEGTLIDTPTGPVSVERLRMGDVVLTASGGMRPVRWIGFRRLDLTRYADPRLARPIRIVSGAFGDGLPRRDLRISPDHALYIDGLLIPARMLVNGMTIHDDEQCRSVTYYHVELDAHDILLVEGLPAESYLDTGNRSVFANGSGLVQMCPAFADVDDQTRRTAGSCAPFVTDEPAVKPVWDRLSDRAVRALGYERQAAVATTDDPHLCLMIEGRQLMPVSAGNGRYTFVLPPVGGSARLVSRSWVPADACPWLDDRRRLGVLVDKMTLQQGAHARTIPMDHPMFRDGWWSMERSGCALRRWTNGDAGIGQLPGQAILAIDVASGAPNYPVAETVAAPRSRRVA